MALQTYVGSFANPLGTTTQAVTGLGFQPSAVIFWSAGTGPGLEAGCGFRVGFDDGATHLGCASTAANNTTPTETDAAWSSFDSLIAVRPTAFNEIYRYGAIQSIDADGFTLRWADFWYSPARQESWNFLALGGSIQHAIGEFAFPSSAAIPSTGSQTISGLGFRPSCVFILRRTNGVNEGLTTGPEWNGTPSFGVMCSGTRQAVMAFSDRTGQAASLNGHAQSVGASSAIALNNNGTSAASSIAWNTCTADGFTIDYTITSSKNSTFCYLALAGCSVDVGALLQPASTGVQTISGVRNTPRAVMLFSANAAVHAGPATGVGISIGATDGTHARADFAGDLNGQNPTISAVSHGTELLSLITPASPASSSVINAQCSLDSFGAGSFGLNWGAVDATARQVIWIALGTGPSVPADPCEAVTPIPQSVTRYMRRLRRFAGPFDQNLYVFLSDLEVLIQSGVGLATGQGSDPVMTVKLSKDGGQTYGPEFTVPMGKIGEFSRRARKAGRLGRGRNWVIEITDSDPVFSAILGCYVNAEAGSS